MMESWVGEVMEAGWGKWWKAGWGKWWKLTESLEGGMREADRKLGGGILAAQYIMHAYLHAFLGNVTYLLDVLPDTLSMQ